MFPCLVGTLRARNNRAVARERRLFGAAPRVPLPAGFWTQGEVRIVNAVQAAEDGVQFELMPTTSSFVQ